MKVEEVFRVGSYWLTVITSLWTLGYFYAYGTERGGEWLREDLAAAVSSHRSCFSFHSI